MKRLILLMALILIMQFIFGFSHPAIKNKTPGLNKIQGLPQATLLNISNISHWIGSDGLSAHNPNTADDGIFFPRLTANVIFADGIVWGGQAYDGITPQLRVGGSTYYSGLRPGAILGIGTGIVEDPNDAGVRIWRVRLDWGTADFYDEVQEQGGYLSAEEIRQQYQTDWNEWPASKGAPFDDVDDDGIYNPLIDIPGIPGADQTVWFVANDINGYSLYGSPAIGLEMQETLWAYQRPENDPFGDIVFKQVRMIYKGTASTPANSTIGDMYMSQWVDPDIGYPYDDFVGCDSLYSMGYGYNGSSKDVYFNDYELSPPAFGYILLYGPKIYSPGDTALVNFESVPDYKNLSMSSFLYFSAGSPDNDPQLYDYSGTLAWYNLMQGLRPQSGEPWINPIDGKETVYPLSGDPISKEGWIDGISYPPADRRMGMTSGPFSMALGDTQEVMVVLIGEIGSEGFQAYLKNIDGMKNKAKSIKGILKNKIAVYISAESITPLFQEIQLKGSYFLFDPTLTVNNMQWALITKPEGSNSDLSETTGDSVYLTPDVEGTYKISLTVNTQEGFSASNTVELYASDDKPPVVNFTLTPDTIILGNSLLADGSSTYDLEGDSLTFNWNSTSSYIELGYSSTVFGTILENGKKYEIEPTGTGEYTACLNVSDGIFESNTTREFYVEPKLENISLVYSYLDTNWYRTSQCCFYDNKLFMAIEPLDIVRVYNFQENDISIEGDIHIPDPVKVYKVDNTLIYIGTSGSSGYWGPGKLSIYQLGSDWEATPVLENYQPGSFDISGMYFNDNYVYLMDNSTLYRIDFETNPASPQIMAQRQYPYYDACYTDITGQYLYVRVIDENYNRTTKILDKVSLDYICDLPMPEGWRTHTTGGTLMFIGIYDTLQIYSVANPLQPEKLSSIVIPQAFDWEDDLYSQYSCSGKYVKNNILSVRTPVGIQFYDIADRSNPQLRGAWYGGKSVSVYEHNGEYYIMGFDVIGTMKDTYLGLNKVNLDFPISIPEEESEKLPEKYALTQNYPNPFNPNTTLEFALPKSEWVTLKVFNILGQQVTTLVSEKLNAGIHKYYWKAEKMPSGIYYCRMKAGKFEQVRKMILLK